MPRYILIGFILTTIWAPAVQAQISRLDLAEAFIEQQFGEDLILQPTDKPGDDALATVAAAETLRQLLMVQKAVNPAAATSISRYGYRASRRALRYDLQLSGRFTPQALLQLLQALRVVADAQQLGELELELRSESFNRYTDTQREVLQQLR